MAKTVAVISPGEMGSAVGNVLRLAGHRVVTSLAGRSTRSRELAQGTGMIGLGSDLELVNEADALLSIVPPDRALGLAERMAAALKESGSDLLYVDCNAVSPGTMQAVAAALSGTRARVADVGIIGSPPGPGRSTRLYASGGAAAAEFVELAAGCLDVRLLGSELGQASGFKMFYAGLTKGMAAMAIALMTGAEKMDLSDALRAEYQLSLPTLLEFVDRIVPTVPPKAYRWGPEMLEIAKTLDELGLSPLMHQGAAAVYDQITATELGKETPEVRNLGTTTASVVEILAKALHKA